MPDKQSKHWLARHAIWLVSLIAAVFVWLVMPSASALKQASTRQQKVEPGKLTPQD